MEQSQQKMCKDFLEREAVAGQYYKLIALGHTSKNNEAVRKLRERLNELEEIIGDNPDFVAFLKKEREEKRE